MQSQKESKKVKGLALQSNSFAVPEGSYERLDNCIIVHDNIIQKRRGEADFYDVGDTVTARNLGEYQDKLLGFCGDVVQVYNQAADGSFDSISSLGGTPFTLSPNQKARNVESNGNLYFTADEGVFKLESTTADVLEAGIEPATDLQIFTQDKSAAETFFRPDSQISYRTVFGRKDANSNTVLGAPSQIVSTTNILSNSSSATLAGTTVTVGFSDHGLSVSDVIYVVNADSTGIPDGNYTVATVPNANEFTFEANTGDAGTELSFGTYKVPTLDFAVPTGITTEFFYRVYRSTASAAQDIEADESTLQLVDEQNLTAAQVSTGFVIYKDETPDILRQGFLYTNPNTGEPRGILEANERPPRCEDIALFKNHVFYSNVDTSFNLTLNLLASDSTNMPDDSELTITQGVTVRTYIGKLQPKVGNATVEAESVSFSSTTVTITQTDHGFSDGDVIAIAQALDSSDVQLSELPQGNYTVANASANDFEITAPSEPTGLTKVSFSGVEDSAGKRIFYIEDSAQTTVASAIASTARALVRAINRDASAPCFAYYTSNNNSIPGMMVLRSKEVTDTFNVNAVTAAIVETFNPPIPTTGTDVEGTRTDGQGQLFFSKPNEPEAVPLVNNITVGSKSSAILRIAPLRDSLIIFKEDGCFRLNGDTFANFVVTVLDSTIRLKATDSVAILDNQVYCLADQGVIATSETTASIVSRAIEPVFTSTAGNSLLENNTHAFAYESERLYIISTIDPTSTQTDKTYVFNHLTSAWSTWNSKIFLDGYVKSSDDHLYQLNLNNFIFRERKNNNRLDYSAKSYPGVVTSSVDNTAIINFTGSDGIVGDVVEFNNIIARITGVSGSGATTNYTFSTNVSFEATDSVTLYKAIISEIRTSPFSAGIMSQLKQFSELQGNFRQGTACSACEIYFVNDTSNSEFTYWESELQSDGWGFTPWGSSPWGDDDAINLSFETDPGQPLRVYIPLEAQRGTYIQANIIHRVAAQAIRLQNLAFTSRIYKQRTTK